MGDSDRRAWIIALVGGIVGGLIATRVGAFWGAYVPTFVYQLGLPDVSAEMGVGESQASKGFSRVFVALLAAWIPATVGFIVGWAIAGFRG
jgi:hypothetical protein